MYEQKEVNKKGVLRVNIFILEKNESDRKQLERILLSWFQKNKLPYEIIVSTNNSAKYMKTSLKENSQNIYFLDTNVNGNEGYGLEIAKEIRKKDSLGHIVLVSESKKYASLTYKYMISALDYIFKQKNKEDFESDIITCLNYVKEFNQKLSDRSPHLFVCETNESIQVEIDDILYFENDSDPHQLNMVTYNSRQKISGKISTIEDKYPSLFRCHRSCIVNVNNIRTLNTQTHTVHFNNGEFCKVSKRKWSTLQSLMNERRDNTSKRSKNRYSNQE